MAKLRMLVPGLAILAALAFFPRAQADEDEVKLKGKIKIAGHSYKMKADTLYLISAKGKGIQPLVLIRPEAGGEGSFSFPRDNLSFLPPRNGTYQLLVFPQISPNLEEGEYDYTLNIIPVALAAKPLVQEDNKLTDKDPPYPPRNSPFKAYAIQLKANQYYIIDLVRKGEDRIDPYLYLENPQGKVVANDDDGGGFPNARLVFRPDADGEYRIIATTLFKGAGEYRLTVRTEKK